MCFVNGDAGQFSLVVDSIEMLAKALSKGVLGGNVEESGSWMATA